MGQPAWDLAKHCSWSRLYSRICKYQVTNWKHWFSFKWLKHPEGGERGGGGGGSYRRKARAMASLWRSPPLNFKPLSPTSVSYPLGIRSMVLLSCASSAACIRDPSYTNQMINFEVLFQVMGVLRSRSRLLIKLLELNNKLEWHQQMSFTQYLDRVTRNCTWKWVASSYWRFTCDIPMVRHVFR